MSDAPASNGSGEPDPGYIQTRLDEGRQMFLGVELLCGTGVLVPRPETELLGTTAIEHLTAAAGEPRVVDMCCGTGNLACAIGVHVPRARLWACDLTLSCVEWARRNVSHLGLAGRVEVRQGDLFAALAGAGLEHTVDLLVCNPPYISTGRLAADRASLLEQEPREAFDGGPYGLSVHQRVVSDAVSYLKRGGLLMMEFGLGQERQVRILLERTRAYDAIEFKHDLRNQPRVVVARLT